MSENAVNNEGTGFDGKKLMGLLSGDASDEEIEAFGSMFSKMIKEAHADEREEEEEDEPDPKGNE